MTKRIYNFSSGPAVMPTEVLEKAQAEMLSLQGIGMSVMEISHRSKVFEKINNDAQQGIKDLLGLSDDYQVLFMQGGATLQFTVLPMNFLAKDKSADFVVTGTWSKKAVKEAARYGRTNTVFSSEDSGFRTVPAPKELNFDANAAYIHYTSNETIDGTEFKYDLDGGAIPIFCDASSNILSKPIDISKYALIYAGAQKNIGASGVTVVIVRKDLLEKIPADLPPTLSLRAFAENNSLLNTPNTWGIYLIGLVTDWLKSKGGLATVQIENEAKAKLLYDALDKTDFYRPHAEKPARSTMNVTFRLPSEELEQRFCAEAAEIGLDGLKGHRSVGGVRASIYNAFPREGVETLVNFMREFERKNG
jgi:phosphoserine aminotransferase